MEDVTAAGVLDGVRSWLASLSPSVILSMRSPAALLKLSRASDVSFRVLIIAPCSAKVGQASFFTFGLENHGLGLLFGVLGLASVVVVAGFDLGDEPAWFYKF